jgi:hypothetical protein
LIIEKYSVIIITRLCPRDTDAPTAATTFVR